MSSICFEMPWGVLWLLIIFGVVAYLSHRIGKESVRTSKLKRKEDKK